MNTSKWGSSAWQFFFNIGLSYKGRNPTPSDLDEETLFQREQSFLSDTSKFANSAKFPLNLQKLSERERIVLFFRMTGEVLPCKYCRESYRGSVEVPEKPQNGFINDLPTDFFLGNSERLIEYVYLLKDKVNQKLLGQENVKADPNPETVAKLISPNFEVILNRQKKKKNLNSLDYIHGGWTFLYCVAMNYKEKPSNFDKEKYAIFFNILPYVLPPDSSMVALDHIKKNPLTTRSQFLESRSNLVWWLYNMDNKIIDYLNSKHFRVPKNPSFEELCSSLETLRAKCNPATQRCDIPENNSCSRNMDNLKIK